MSDDRVFVGLLGWSNKRSGLEFYRWDEKIIPRHGSEWGDLLAQQIPRDFEGSPVVVTVLPRDSTPEDIVAAVGELAVALRKERDG